MAKENRESELARLRNEEKKTCRDEVYGGLTIAERAEYNRAIRRINELEIKLHNPVDEKKKKCIEKATPLTTLTFFTDDHDSRPGLRK
jgi:hypothetical protein